MIKKLSFILVLSLLLCAAPLTVGAESCTEGFICGDANGDGLVTVADVVGVLKYIAKWETDVNPAHVDALPDGKINLSDVTRMLKYIARWDDVHRLGHDDEYAVVDEATTEHVGHARWTCRLCGDYDEVELPMKSYSIFGCDLSDYVIIYSTEFETPAISDYPQDIADMIEERLGIALDLREIKTASEMTKAREKHEILLGSTFSRPGIPEHGEFDSFCGVTEDGTIYMGTPARGNYTYMWRLFASEYMGVPMKGDGLWTKGCSVTESGDTVVPGKTSADLEAEGYSLVFADEFNGDGIDYSVWDLRNGGKTGKGYGSKSQAQTYDGNLHLRAEYLTDGEYGPGWYVASIRLKERYARGYFEARLKCSEYDAEYGFWSAFWIQGPAPYKWDKSQGGAGPGGAELDIIEGFGDRSLYSNIWACGAAGIETEELDNGTSEPVAWDSSLVDDFHVYGLEWDEDFYSFYIDGVLLWRTDFATGTSSVPEEIILSMCMAKSLGEETTFTADMTVDYLRIWQK